MASKKDIVPQSYFRFPNLLPNFWEEAQDRLSKWMGEEANTGVTVSEDDSNVYVEAHLPGLKANDIDISIKQNTVWIKGEKKEEVEDDKKKYYRRAQSSFFYQVDLPAQVEDKSEKAQFQDGVLTITFKKTQQSQVRKITLEKEQKTQNKNKK